MDDIVKEFLIESTENLDRMDQELVKLEGEPESKELLDSIFRTIHTIKGSAGFLGFTHLQKVAHAGENLLSRLRERQLRLTAEVASGLLAMVDAIRSMLAEIQSSEHDGENDYPDLLESLKQLQEIGREEQRPAAQGAGEAVAAQAAGEENARQLSAVEPAAPAATALEAHAGDGQSPAAPPDLPKMAAPEGAGTRRPLAGKLGGMLVESGRVSAEDLTHALGQQEHGDQRRLGEILVALELCKPEDIQSALQTIESRGRETGVETVRVGVPLLDRLMNLVGELVLTRNQLLQFSARSSDPGVLTISQRMNLIASELQQEVMKTRMQPIGNTWSKFPRTVRDLALSCGKQVRLEMEGQETELDRTIIEAVKDPMTHLVRNAVDHGIEAPETRQNLGKPASGRLSLRAYHEGGQVNIEIADDGAGLDQERIRKKAIEREIVTREQAARMPEHELFNLIFLPGFSTAEKVTNVSGRGVGMDVVRTNLEKIGGRVDLQSAAGKGTTVRIKIPLTLAIIPALVVKTGRERFAIPQISLTELVHLDSEQSIERAHSAAVYRLRGQVLPLVYLRDVLYPPEGRREKSAAGDPGSTQGGSVKIAVLQAASRKFGLVVDEILDTQEIVVKPLGNRLKGIGAYAGATIMGDGSVALILDVAGLARQAGIFLEASESGPAARAGRAEDADSARGGDALLLAETDAGRRIGIPLQSVARLEEFPGTVIERSGNQKVMQYRGRIIPLVWLSEDSNASLGELSGSSIQVVIYSEGARTVGLVVDRILDIVGSGAPVESVHPRPGVTGTCVVDKKVTDLLDVASIVRHAVPGFLENSAEART